LGLVPILIDVAKEQQKNENYLYSLIADGIEVSTLRMILTNN